MFKLIKYEDIDNSRFKGSNILIDVRSPSEFTEKNIPNSVNIPVFNNEERKKIGIIYKEEDTEAATKLGIEIASKKLPAIYEKVTKLNKKYDKLIFFCARGGFRSSSLVSLFKTLKVHAFKLDNGYKGYRQYVNENLPKVVGKIQFVVLYGNTGTGKTNILKALKEKGESILDLEGCANHRGSILGSVGLGEQNTQKTFEGLIYDSLKNRSSDIVFVEGESRKIGQAIIPKAIYNAMDSGTNIYIDTHMDKRIDNILRDYVHGTDGELKSSLNFLRSQLGHKTINRCRKMIDNNQHRDVAKELMLKYYDPHYQCKNRKYTKTFENLDSKSTAQNIIKWLDAYNM